MLVIIPCGDRKAATARPASLMYTGPYFKSCLSYARSLTTDDNIHILSSKYGLLSLTKVIDRYEMRITDKDAISDSDLRDQAISQELLNESNVIIVAGDLYSAKLLKLWPHAQTPLKGKGKMGQQMNYMNQQTAKESGK